MAFFIDTSKVGAVSDSIDQISDKCGDVLSSVESYDTNNDGGFDFSGAKAAIKNNLEGAETKFKNTVALLTAVINAHGGIQESVSGSPSGTTSSSSSIVGCSSRGCGSVGCGSKGCGGCGSSATPVNGNPTPVTLTPSPYEHGEFKNYYQYNYQQSYGYGTTIASAGCGPTSMSMVLTYLLDETHDPVEVANWSLQRGYHIPGNGTAWAFFPACAKAYNIECSQMGVSRDAIIKYLQAGKIIIMNVGPGHFTSGGHYIVLRGITADGKIIVADPASEARSKQVWDIDVFLKEGKGMWVFDGGKLKKEEPKKEETPKEETPEPEPEEPKEEPKEDEPKEEPKPEEPEEEKQSLLEYLREINQKYADEHSGSETFTKDTGAISMDSEEKFISDEDFDISDDYRVNEETNTEFDETTNDSSLDTSDLEGMIN